MLPCLSAAFGKVEMVRAFSFSDAKLCNLRVPTVVTCGPGRKLMDMIVDAYDGDEPYFFVCYSHADADLVFPEMQWLQASGVNLWYDQGIEAGATWRRAVAEALEKAAGVIFLCSSQSLTSTHCGKEISYALDHEKPIYVVRLDAAELTPELALYLNDTQILQRDRQDPEQFRRPLLRALGRHTGVDHAIPETARHEGRFRLHLAFAAGVVALLLAGSWFFYDATRMPETPVAEQAFDFPRVAIMPMEVLTPNDTLQFLARASEEDLRSRMQASVYQPVSVPESEMNTSAVELGATYDVDYVWYRSVALQGDVVRVAKRLTETRTGGDVEVFQHDLPNGEPFELQDELAKYTEEIMGAMDRGERERADELPLDQMTARQLTYTSKGNRKENIRRALAMAPDLYSANSAVASDLFNDYFMQRVDDPAQASAEALRLAQRGLQLAPFDQYAIEVAASVELGVGNPDLAYRYVKQFIDRYKSFSTYIFYDVLIATGHPAEALAHAENNPLVHHSTLGHANIAVGQYREAAEHYRNMTVEQPNNPFAWLYLANALGYLDQKEEVKRIMDGLRARGWPPIVANIEIGSRRYWGESGFADVLLDGLRRLGYE